jgi:cytochrome b
MQLSATATVWDLPTRLFHWSLLPLLITAWVSAEEGYMEVHEWCGYTVLVLVAFRVLWGFAGSQHSRFSSFLRGPGAVMRYFRGGEWSGEGHNPAGGWSVALMLALLLSQGVSGLFNEDDISFSGPLAHLAGGLSSTVSEWHELNFNLLLAMVGVHIIAVLLYLRGGKNLVRPMITGGSAAGQTIKASAWLALVLLAGCATLLWWLLSLAPKPAPFL